MIFPIHIPKQSYSEEIKQIREDVAQIKDRIPRKSAYQEERGKLQDQVMQNESIIKSQENLISRLISLNEKLLEYINNIEEIKNSGGVEVSFVSREDLYEPRMLQVKMVTIPEVKIAMVEEA